jgi:hypothetical protein
MAENVDRGALYYPFIHVRNEDWLKATLLCFPFMDRMVPEAYEVNDEPFAAAFSTTPGRFGRMMLGRRELDEPATDQARVALLRKLEEDFSEYNIPTRFSRDAAVSAYPDGENAFQIHEYKIGSALIEFLKNHGMAWQPTRPVRGGAPWWAVHPLLGETIMSTNAVALATAHDLEIVTSDGPIHQSLLGARTGDVYDTLVRQQLFGLPREDTVKVNDLVRFVFLSAFDLQKLSVSDIAELNRQRADLAALKAELLSEVKDVGGMPDREVWQDVLSVRVADVVSRWRDTTSPLSVVAHTDAKQIADEFQGVLKTVAPFVIAGGTAAALVGAMPGLAVGVVFGSVTLVRGWREAQRPYRFLSRLEGKAGVRHVLELSPT